MSRSRERGPVKPSAETLGRTRPSAMADLMKIINKGMDKDEPFPYWMNKATKWRGLLVKAVEAGNKEWIFVCAARTTVFIYEKVLKHPDCNESLTADQIRILQSNGQSLLKEVSGLKKELNEAYAQWQAVERVRKQQLERDLSRLQSVLTTEEGEDKPLPTVPFPDPEPEMDSLQAIQTRALEVSRPGSPALDSPTSQHDLHNSRLMRAPSRSPSPPISDGPSPPTYEEVMGDILEVDGTPGGDGGSDYDYNIQVVAPDPISKPVTPQISPEISLPAYEKEGRDAQVECPPRGRRSSRASSIASNEKKSRSRSANGDLRVSNPTISLEEQGLIDVGIALDRAYNQLALLRKGGLRKLPDDITKKINDLHQFLL